MNILLLFFLFVFLSCNATKSSIQNIPPCIGDKIQSFKKEQKQNPPRSITQYNYKGRKVYYIPALCCDQFSEVLDENCNSLGHPDGGFTGRGDGQLPDFAKEVKEEKLIWKDDR